MQLAVGQRWRRTNFMVNYIVEITERISDTSAKAKYVVSDDPTNFVIGNSTYCGGFPEHSDKNYCWEYLVGQDRPQEGV